ncbi:MULTISPECIES: type VI secretion system protein TssA [Psychrobacter]|jgi:type VI secretion system protein ImpA|uniref:type VI secretion system protein TssA n=1 Tax=Psychrobacter TaxID=497 RepID=UPI0003FE2A69|nr:MULTISPECIES: type VI secretion system protein TssA [Psychrobacter]PKG35739.1 type VI secretion system protein TssA [Psychrobacter sp. Sarcosine-3u-12]
MNMGNSLLTDIDTLIAPIDGSHHGVGEDLIFDPRIDAIVAARQEDDPLLAQGNWVTELKVADWDFVKNQCADLLSHTSKDMKLALWYVDALSHTNHLAGISHGLSVLQAFNDEYWLTMYPPLDGEEDSMDIRAGLLSWFVKALTDDIKQLSLADSKAGNYNYNYYLTARDHDKQRQQNPDSETSNQLTLSDYNHAIKTSNEAWQQALMSNLNKVTEQWQTLTDQLNNLMGMDAPVFAPVTDLLVALTQHLRPLIPEYSDDNSNSAQDSVADIMDSMGDSDSVMSDSSGQSASAKNISSTSFNPSNRDHQSNRQQALKLLGQIQDYFATNEPHSPVTFLLGRAIDWADMPLDQWLTHIIKNEDQLATLSDMIGIQPKRDSSDDGY